MSWTENADHALRMLLENMVAEGLLAKQVGVDATPAQIVGASREMLLDVINCSLPLARIMDTSDLVLHAEGPSVKDASPKLNAFNWLTSTAERTIRRMSGNLFDLSSRDAKHLSRALDLRLTGIARGSIYAGFSIETPAPDLIAPEDEPIILSVREALRQLPEVSQFIQNEHISREINEFIEDPALRDTAMDALYRLSPTGSVGIHTIDIASPGTRSAKLSQRERIVLREALLSPKGGDRKPGAFAGEVREIDLDAHRFHLRGVAGIGNLRCAIGNIEKNEAKNLIGEYVRVEGDYESNREGKPRLMMVHSFEMLQRDSQPDLV
ncbi:MAG: hypothetical protein IT473_02045 [Lysobacter sp.]|nr:hypothetical protein [Lysobacter sp.]